MERVGDVVVVKVSGEDGARMALDSELVIGREEDCDIRIRLPAVSRLQATIRFDGTKASALSSCNRS